MRIILTSEVGVPCSRGCCDTQAAHYRSISFGTSVRAKAVEAKEQRWARDHAAYRRLRADGLQPRDIDGAAEVEAKAVLPIEVEMGRVAKTAQERASYKAGVEISTELGLTG